MSVKFFHTLLAVIGFLGVLGFLSSTPAPVAYAATIVVNTTDDNANGGEGKCTLREAINNANADGDTSNGDCTAGDGYDTITFQISGTITLSSVLPTITTGMTIDATLGNVTLDATQSFAILRL